MLTSWILFEYIKIIIPIIMKIIPKDTNVIVVLVIVGTGRHAGSFCCLNFEAFNLSYTSSWFYVPSSSGP